MEGEDQCPYCGSLRMGLGDALEQHIAPLEIPLHAPPQAGI